MIFHTLPNHSLYKTSQQSSAMMFSLNPNFQNEDRNMLETLQSLGFSDVNIVVANVEYPLHRIVLCQFPFFRPLLAVDGTFHQDMLELDADLIDQQDWENALTLIYGRLYPDRFKKNFTADEQVQMCMLLDYLQGIDLADEIFEYLVERRCPNLCDLAHIERYSDRAIRSDYRTGIDLIKYPEAFSKIFKDFPNSGVAITPGKIRITRIDDKQRKLLHFDWFKNLNDERYEENWNELPDKCKKMVAIKQHQVPSCVIRWALDNDVEVGDFSALASSSRVHDFFRETHTLDKQHKIAVSFARNYLGNIPYNWRIWIRYSEQGCQGYYLWLLMNHKQPDIAQYVEKHMQTFLHSNKFTGVERRLHEQLLAKYRRYQ